MKKSSISAVYNPQNCKNEQSSFTITETVTGIVRSARMEIGPQRATE